MQTFEDMLQNGIKELTRLENMGKELAVKVKTTQLRKFLGSIKRIQADYDKLKNEVIMLAPRLAYASGRNRELSAFYNSFKDIIPKIDSKEKFDNFTNMIESIVAYHKLNNGKD